MIKFALRCEAGHVFDSWFRDNQAYDALAAAGHVSCATCGSTHVEKALMAPAIVTTRRRKSETPSAPVETPAEPATAKTVAMTDERATIMRAALRELRDHLVRHSSDVGPQFASEARRIHEGVSDKTAIHGQASHDEVRSLIEDGIEVMPLPTFPDDRN